MQWEERHYFSNRSRLMQIWGVTLLLVTCGLWIWLGYLLLTSYTVSTSSHTYECDPPIVDSYASGSWTPCASERDWPDLMLILAASVPPALVGTGLCVGGSTRKQISAHVFEIIEMQKSEERLRNRQDGQGSPS